MVEQNPPDFEQSGCWTAEGFRDIFASMVCEPGVVDRAAGDLLVTAVGGGSVNVSVAAGSAWVEGTLNGAQGMYRIYNDAAEVQTITANGAGSSRIDLVIASVYDSQYVGGVDQWAIEVITGVAGGGVPAVPTSTRSGYIILGEVTVPASGGTPSVVADVRPSMRMCGSGLWEDYTPTLTGVTGTFEVARWINNNGVINAWVRLVFTAAPTGEVQIGLPVPNPEFDTHAAMLGPASVYDISITGVFGGFSSTFDADTFHIYFEDGAPPMVTVGAGQGWDTGDVIDTVLTYEAAL